MRVRCPPTFGHIVYLTMLVFFHTQKCMLVIGGAHFGFGLERQHGFVLLRWLLTLYCGTVYSTLVVRIIRPTQRRTQQTLKHLADRTESGEHISHSPPLLYQMSDLKHSFPKKRRLFFLSARWEIHLSRKNEVHIT